MSRRKTAAHSLIQRAQIILLAEKMQSNKAVAEELNISASKVAHWTHRWQDFKKINKPIIERLADAERPGKPPTITPEQICQLVALACDNPENYRRPISHWTQPELADEAIKQNIFDTISSRQVLAT